MLVVTVSPTIPASSRPASAEAALSPEEGEGILVDLLEEVIELGGCRSARQGRSTAGRSACASMLWAAIPLDRLDDTG